jgi:hypothetical protein
LTLSLYLEFNNAASTADVILNKEFGKDQTPSFIWYEKDRMKIEKIGWARQKQTTR